MESNPGCIDPWVAFLWVAFQHDLPNLLRALHIPLHLHTVFPIATRKELGEAAVLGDFPKAQRLLAEGAEEKEKQNALAISVSHRRAQIVQELLEAGAYPTRGVLNQAIRRKYWEILRMLLIRDAYVAVPDREWAMFYACKYGIVELATAVTMLLDNGADVMQKDNAGITALTWATIGGHYVLVQLLIRYQAPLNSTDWLRRTAVHHAVRNRDDKIAHILAHAGEHLYLTVHLEGALVWACIHGYSAIVDRVLYASRNAHELDADGVSALMHATINGHLEYVKQLLENTEYPVAINATDSHGRTALWYAIMKEQTTIEKLLRIKKAELGTAVITLQGLRLAVLKNRLTEVQEILKKAASLQVEGFKSLLYALRMRMWNIAQLLVDATGGGEGDAFRMIESREQHSLLMVAMEEECPAKILLKLMEKGAVKESRDEYGETPLLVAVRRGDYDATMALLQKGANSNATDAENNTALDIAFRRREGDLDEQQALLIKELIDRDVNTKVDLEKIHRDVAEVLGTKKRNKNEEANGDSAKKQKVKADEVEKETAEG